MAFFLSPIKPEIKSLMYFTQMCEMSITTMVLKYEKKIALVTLRFQYIERSLVYVHMYNVVSIYVHVHVNTLKGVSMLMLRQKKKIIEVLTIKPVLCT